VIGIDPNAAGMRDASRLAARRPEKGGLPNAVFVLAAAQNLPAELGGRIDELQIAFPWGSLLRGVACAEPWLVDAVHRVLRSRAEVRILLSVTDRDSTLGLPVLDARSVAALAATYRALGFAPIEARAATSGDVRESGSGWARRLDVPRRRPAWYLRLQAPDQSAGTAGGGGDV
jgi:16S rRNA (adenine(1408)-N(1))-methyltransferase